MQPDTQWFIYKRPVEDPYVLIGQVSTCVYQSLTELLNIFPVMNQSFILWGCQWKTGRLPEGKSQERILVRKDVKEWREHGVELVEGSDGGLLRGRHATAAEVVVLLMDVGHLERLSEKHRRIPISHLLNCISRIFIESKIDMLHVHRTQCMDHL